MRKLYSGLLLVLLLPILAACGGAAPGTDTPATSTEASAAASVAASTAPTPAETEEPSAAASVAASPAADETETAQAGSGSCELQVALVTDVGKINDGTFNQFAYEGLQRAGEELGVQIDYIETQQPTDYERNLGQFADQGYDLVIGVGFLMGDAIKAAAARYPDVNFAIVDAAPEDAPENLKPLLFREDQAGYLVGTMAALVTQNNNIGVVGGVQIPPVENFVEGYRAGALAVNPDIIVQDVYIPSFTDPAQGAEAARSQIAEGADVIFGAGGQTGSGAIQAAAREGAYVIGVDQDEYVTTFNNGSVEGADRIITSALKRVDNAVFQTIESACNDEFSGEAYIGTAENEGVGFAEAHDATDAITDEIVSRVEEVQQGLADGSITTGRE